MSSTLAEPTEQDLLFGRIAVELGFITHEQLASAVKLQGDGRKLGEVLLDQRWIGSDQLLEILRQQRLRGGGSVAAPRPTPVGPAGPASLPRTPAATRPVAVPSPPARAAAPPLGVVKIAGSRRGADPVLERYLRATVEQGGSDLHLHGGSRPRIRRNGELAELAPDPLSPQRVTELTRASVPDELLESLDRDGQVDFVFTLPGVARFRANAYRQQHGFDLVLRAIPPQPPTLASLGLPRQLAALTQHHQGLVLVTGPSGCGKTATLAALINVINQDRHVHILTAEEPIEYRQPSLKALVNQREVGVHSESYERILRGALREDPDVIALGDLRDHASIGLALTAAETGHLVMATMHTGGAIRTINRLIGAFPPNEQDQVRVMVSESLRAVVSQRLVPRRDGKGRVVALELLIANRAVANLIRERKTFQIENVLQLGTAEGMCTLDQSLDRLMAKGLVTREAAARHRPEAYLVADIAGGSRAGA